MRRTALNVVDEIRVQVDEVGAAKLNREIHFCTNPNFLLHQVDVVGFDGAGGGHGGHDHEGEGELWVKLL